MQSTHNVAERLATEFDGIVPPERVASIVLAAASDLTGQVQTEAFPELLHRLAHYRLEIGVVPVNAADRLDSRCPQRGNAACR